MNAKILFLCSIPLTGEAQGFAGLGTEAEGFAIPQQGYDFDFPKDHGPHYAYRIEWWYLTANLVGPDGTPYGLQWTLFRSGLAPETQAETQAEDQIETAAQAGWAASQVWMGHAAVTTPDAHYVTERLARGGIGQAGATAAPFAAWIDEWVFEGTIDAAQMRAAGPQFAYDMQLTAQGPLIFHGDQGYSVKAASGQASYYYSQPFYDIAGTLTLPSGQVAVTGSAWLDREWSSQPLGADQTGWDWFSLSFADGNKLMGFLLRQEDGTRYSSATWIDADGTTRAYADGAFDATPLAIHNTAGRDVPVGWQVTLPAKGVDVTVTALNPDAWMATSIPYWEGPVTITGSHDGAGYLEMTGYD